MPALADDLPPTPTSTSVQHGLPLHAGLPDLAPATTTNSHARNEATRIQDALVLKEAERLVSQAQNARSDAHSRSHASNDITRDRTNKPVADGASGHDSGSERGSIHHERRRLNRRRSSFSEADVFAPSESTPAVGQHRRYKKKDKDKDKSAAFAKFVRRVHGSHVFIRYFTYIIPVVVILLIPLLIGAVKYRTASVGGVTLMWFSIWLMVVWLTLWAARLIAIALPTTLSVLLAGFTKNRKKWRDMGRHIELAATLFLWWLAIEISFIPTMTNHHLNGDRTVRPWQRTMNKVLISILVGTILNFIEKIIIQLIAMSFHLRTYQDRIELNKLQIDALTKLYIRSKEILAIGDGDFQEKVLLQSPASPASSATKIGEGEVGASRQDNAQVQPEEQNQNAVFAGSKESPPPTKPKKARPFSMHQTPSSDGTRTPARIVKGAQLALNQIGGAAEMVAGKVAEDFSGSGKPTATKTNRDVVRTLLQSADSSLSLARQLFRAFANKERDTVLPDSFDGVFEDDDEAEAAFLIFDKDLNGDISMAELEAVCVEIGLERKAITESLQDLDSVISKLDNVFVFIVIVITLLVFVSLISSGAATAITSAGSTVLALSWLFSATAQEFLQSIVFVFVKHPFDVGDRVTVYGNTGLLGKGDDYYVKKISLLYTEFRKLQGHVVQAPNSYLNTLFILNQRRSGGLAEAVELTIKFGTTLDQIDTLRARLLEFVSAEKREYRNKILTELREVSEAHSIKLNVVFFYKSNWQNELLRLYRRNKFICKLMVTMQELEIEGPRMRYPGQKQSFPVYIQQALHSVPPPRPGYWGTPDHPAGVAARPTEQLPPSGGVDGDADLFPPMPDPGPAGQAGRTDVGSSTGHDHGLGRMPTTQSSTQQRRRNGSNTSSNPNQKQQDYSLGMEEMAGEHWPGDVYDGIDEKRLEKIHRGLGTTRKRRPTQSGRDVHSSARSTRESAEPVGRSRGVSSGEVDSTRVTDGAGAVPPPVPPVPPGFGVLHRSLTDHTKRGNMYRRLMSLRGRKHQTDLEDGMTPIPETAAPSPRLADVSPVGQQRQQQGPPGLERLHIETGNRLLDIGRPVGDDAELRNEAVELRSLNSTSFGGPLDTFNPTDFVSADDGDLNVPPNAVRTSPPPPPPFLSDSTLEDPQRGITRRSTSFN